MMHGQPNIKDYQRLTETLHQALVTLISASCTGSEVQPQIYRFRISFGLFLYLSKFPSLCYLCISLFFLLFPRKAGFWCSVSQIHETAGHREMDLLKCHFITNVVSANKLSLRLSSSSSSSSFGATTLCGFSPSQPSFSKFFYPQLPPSSF